MSSEKLLLARNYEENYGKTIKAGERPLFHVTPRIGWLNDPNGFSYYNGEFHLFHQYHPYSVNLGPMHWGHLKTKDFIRWEWLPAAMAPDASYDNAGCFSGSAVALPDGRHMLMYTGVQEKKLEDGRTETVQVQCLAFGDGIDYEKYEGNPILTAKDLPEGNNPVDFRDPKIWWDEEQRCYYAVIGNRPADGSGAVLLFRSEDTTSWKYVTTLDGSKHQYGMMWECPDFFVLDGTAVILTSPQEMRARGLEFHNGNGNIYVTGTYDSANHHFERSEIRTIDYGLDFYAPQTILTPDGRRVMIGWMQSWEASWVSQPYDAKWFGMMTIPRELRIVNGRLIQNPVRELDLYRNGRVLYRDIDVQERLQLPGVHGRTLDMTVCVRPAGNSIYENFTIKIAKDAENYTAISYRPGNSTLKFDRSNSGFRHDIVSTRRVLIPNEKGRVKLRLLIDRFSVEIFVNDGEQAISSTIFTPLEAEDISFESIGMAIIDVEKYDITLPEQPGQEEKGEGDE